MNTHHSLKEEDGHLLKILVTGNCGEIQVTVALVEVVCTRTCVGKEVGTVSGDAWKSGGRGGRSGEGSDMGGDVRNRFLQPHNSQH